MNHQPHGENSTVIQAKGTELMARLNKTEEEKGTEAKPKMITVLQRQHLAISTQQQAKDREDQIRLIRDSLEDACSRLEELRSDVGEQVRELEMLDIAPGINCEGIENEWMVVELFGLGRLPTEGEWTDAIEEVNAVSNKLDDLWMECVRSVRRAGDLEVEFEWSWGPSDREDCWGPKA